MQTPNFIRYLASALSFRILRAWQAMLFAVLAFPTLAPCADSPRPEIATNRAYVTWLLAIAEKGAGTAEADNAHKSFLEKARLELNSIKTDSTRSSSAPGENLGRILSLQHEVAGGEDIKSAIATAALAAKGLWAQLKDELVHLSLSESKPEELVLLGYAAMNQRDWLLSYNAFAALDAMPFKGSLLSFAKQLETTYPDSAFPSLAKADALLRLGCLESALESINRAISLAPDFEAAAEVKTMILIDRGNFEEASSWLNEALTKWPQSPDLHFQAAMLEFLQGNTDAAVKKFGAAVDTDTSFIFARNARGVAKFLMAETAEQATSAIADFDEAMKIASSFLPAQDNRRTALRLRADGILKIDSEKMASLTREGPIGGQSRVIVGIPGINSPNGEGMDVMMRQQAGPNLSEHKIHVTQFIDKKTGDIKPSTLAAITQMVDMTITRDAREGKVSGFNVISPISETYSKRGVLGHQGGVFNAVGESIERGSNLISAALSGKEFQRSGDSTASVLKAMMNSSEVQKQPATINAHSAGALPATKAASTYPAGSQLNLLQGRITTDQGNAAAKLIYDKGGSTTLINSHMDLSGGPKSTGNYAAVRDNARGKFGITQVYIPEQKAEDYFSLTPGHKLSDQQGPTGGKILQAKIYYGGSDRDFATVRGNLADLTKYAVTPRPASEPLNDRCGVFLRLANDGTDLKRENVTDLSFLAGERHARSEVPKDADGPDFTYPVLICNRILHLDLGENGQ